MSANPRGAADFEDSDRDLRLRRLEARVESLELVTQELHRRLEGPAAENPSKARNRSSASKRDMTDADAEECLTGAASGIGHKAAAAEMGLTYAQIYSCRLEYTFKQVHKRLRDGGFKNGWAKK